MTITTKKLISVIMPCFNSELSIVQSVDSVLQQTYKNLELLIIDDGSTDSTNQILHSIVARDHRVRLFTQENLGPSAARNKGLRKSNGSYIAFLDSDDYWSLDFLEKLEKALLSRSNNKFTLAYCGWQNIGMPGAGGQPFIPPNYENHNLIELCFGGCRWPIHAVLINHECFEKIKGFNERLKNCEDFDLWLRMSIFLNVVLVPEVLSFYRHHEGCQISKNRA
jgi:glycosyltransferase involved in cell wall biosynthesis